jgi:uncharacterized membrane protein YedE/YeeE
MEIRKVKIISVILLTLSSMTIGLLAQRSRMCFIAGIRDFILVRDRELLTGILAFVLTIWLLSSVLYGTGLIDDGIPAPLFEEISAGAEGTQETPFEQSTGDSESQTQAEDTALAVEGAAAEQLAFEVRMKLFGGGIIAAPFMRASIIGGFLLGLITVGAGGCALRQHVLAAQGNGDAKLFLIGFFLMVIIYDLFLRGIVNEWF